MGEQGAGQALKGLAGYTAIWYRGIPIVKDEKCTSGYIYYINTDVTYWSGLPHPKHGMVSLGTSTIEGVGNPVPRNHGISWTGFKEPINQDGETGQFILYGQMLCEMPRYNGVDQGVTAQYRDFKGVYCYFDPKDDIKVGQRINEVIMKQGTK